MEKMKKTFLLAITLVIAGLMITSVTGLSEKISSTSLSAGSPKVIEQNKANVVKIDVSAQYLSMQSQKVTLPQQHQPSTIGSWPAFAYPGDQLHPGFGRIDNGTHMAAYRDGNLANIIWTFSSDDGATYDPGVYYNVGGDYPAIKLWNGSTFCGTYVTDPTDANGGPTYLFNCTDPTNTNTYNLVYWDWSTYGWYNMIDADIACDSSQNSWEWGISTYVTSTTYSSGGHNGYTNGPTIVYADPATSGRAYISWYWFDGCAHTAVDIDPVTHMAYAVYDWYNTTSSKWELLVRVLDFKDPVNGYDALFEIQGTGNLQYPAVAVYNNTLVIVAQTDENGNKDIICYYSNNGMNNLVTSFVANSSTDELYPEVRYAKANTFFCTFVKENNIYASKTEDGGTTWNTPVQINEDNGIVIAEYKTADICERSLMAMWEEQYNDSDIYIGNIWQNQAPGAPSINGPASGKPKVQYNYTLNAIDPDGDNVFYYVNWGDNTNSGWVGPFASGVDATISHTWTKKGTYTVTAKAKDIYGLEGTSATLQVTMPRAKSVNSHPFLQFFLDRFPNAFPILRHLLGL